MRAAWTSAAKEKKEKALAEHVARHPEDVGRTVKDFDWIQWVIVHPKFIIGADGRVRWPETIEGEFEGTYTSPGIEKGEDGEPVMVLMPRVTIVDADKISDEAAAAVAEVSQTVNGALRVKMHDKHAALVLIGRYLGMFDAKVKVDAVYGISEEPMSAEEWKKQFAGN